MRTCPYCGKQYPEDVSICPVDQQPLGSGEGRHQSITGTWRGSYDYLSNPELDVPFTLELREDSPGHFSGTVTEDAKLGMPGTGAIEGIIDFPHIQFVKQMPVCYMTGPEGQFMKLREWLAARDLVCEGDPPHPPVVYKGEFSANDEARGTWVIEPWEIPLADGMSLEMGKASGSWVIKAVTVSDGPSRTREAKLSPLSAMLRWFTSTSVWASVTWLGFSDVPLI